MTIDDLLDHDIDALVERTKLRPLPRDAITLPRAWLFFAMQAILGVFLAFRVLNTARYVLTGLFRIFSAIGQSLAFGSPCLLGLFIFCILHARYIHFPPLKTRKIDSLSSVGWILLPSLLYVRFPELVFAGLRRLSQGVMFAVGVFMGWSELSHDGSIAWDVLVPIYLACVLWTITYETVYQHQVCRASHSARSIDQFPAGQIGRCQNWVAFSCIVVR